MTDRVIRDELLESDRWLDLPSDSHRLAYIGFLLRRIDDFGNMEAGLRGIFRFLHSFTQIKTPEATAAILSHLCDGDLMRMYSVDSREFYHLPRVRPQRQYLVRKFPKSPWDLALKSGREQYVQNKGIAKDQTLAKKLSNTLLTDARHMTEGVGVGVGVGVGGSTKTKSTTLSSSEEKPPNVDVAKRILEFLNQKTGRHYRIASGPNLDFIRARLKDGHTERELRAVVARKCREWKGDAKMEPFLRPATLFNRTNFAQYVGEVPREEIDDGNATLPGM